MITNSNGTTGCARSSAATPANNGPTRDYIAHHAFFQYFASTRNPAHTRPTSPAVIGTAADGGANHQYDLHDFFDALAVGNLPGSTTAISSTGRACAVTARRSAASADAAVMARACR
jgi:hypothetical protein